MNELTKDIIFNISNFTDPNDILNYINSSAHIRRIASKDDFWHNLFELKNIQFIHQDSIINYIKYYISELTKRKLLSLINDNKHHVILFNSQNTQRLIMKMNEKLNLSIPYDDGYKAHLYVTNEYGRIVISLKGDSSYYIAHNKFLNKKQIIILFNIIANNNIKFQIQNN